MDEYVNQRFLVTDNSIDGAFLRAVLAIRRGDYATATVLITRLREVSATAFWIRRGERVNKTTTTK